MQNSKVEAAAASLIEDFKSEDTKIKINAIKSLSIISLTIGKERTRNELLPFIADSIDEEDEEALIELAKTLSSFLEYIGGKNYAGSLFKLFEILIVSDDFRVRTEGLISFKYVLSQINIANHETQIRDMMENLSKSELSSYKIACLNMISTIFPYINSENKNFLKTFVTNMALDQTPSIRKELSNSLKELSPFFDIDIICNLIKNLTKDTNDSVRIYIMDVIISLKLNPEYKRMYDFIMNIVHILSKDESWRVRLTVADKIFELLMYENISDFIKQKIIEIFAGLIGDVEAETRNTCCIRLEKMAELIGKNSDFDLILSALKKLQKDNTSYVRSSLASSLLRLAPLVGKSKTSEYIFPIFLNMINDEIHEIRMILIKNLDRLHEVINIDVYVQSIIPSLFEIASNKSWRVRLQITESIPVIARILTKNLFLENIFSFCIGWLTDDVYTIREIGCKLMKKLYDLFKCEEFEKRLIAKLNEMKSNNFYLIRNTVIMLGKEFANDEFDVDFLERKMAPIIFKLSRDKISNVRVNAAILLKKMSRLVKSREIHKEISLHIEELKRDIDIEVIYAINDN